MHLSSRIPEEVWEKILSNLVSDRQTLAAVIEADCLASGQALRLYWQNDSASKDLLEELDGVPENERQPFADMVRNIVTELKAPGAHHEGKGLQFPQLQSLVIDHGKAFQRRETRTYARVKRFVGSRMRELQIGSEDYDCYDLSPVCDNFMPSLSGSVDLRSLILHSRVRGATAGDLLQVLQRCVRLSTLRLGKDTEPLIDEAVFQTMAGHLEIQELYIKKHLDISLVLSIATTPQPFRNISDLILHADAAAINILLPRIEKVDRLELTIHGMSSIFPSLRHLEKLRSMWLKFHNYALTDDDLTHLIPLKRLEFIELCDDDQGERLNANFISADVFAAVLGSLPLLHSLNLNAIHNLGDPFLLALGRQCPNLDALALTGSFTLEPLANESPVPFPRLVTLELGTLAPSMPLRQWGGFKEDWADQRAQDIIVHAPQLLWFEGCHDGRNEYGGLVEEAWKSLKVQGHLYVGGR